ncbi:TPA: hypothetical protein ACQQHD_004853 [Pseudomonas aeruginosa]|uniref:hypothetical protein n=1 Tax=Pseudomonas aeruginosa TaxID=287 RepID=UPI0005CD9F92|nr:hypothetical protein [Pseudomonas aeruginosa]ELF5753978.1 hypothetical protein [Pseudomonas aeruginosa]KJC15212.1 hypothetical protein TN45_30640 [Pseudomonas aeruginosa]MDG3636873.1 hypothetical protein [Pseudomonas aeruginosa]RTU55308.1 hypothetical protein DZA25_26010 [Pseudomonas aeruginosa]HCF3641476.1 hypothetical protein [Pseudomonas aeruginosa]
MARQNSAAKTTAKSKTDPATEKPKDETLPGSTDATSSTAPEASAAKPQTAPATEKPKDDTLPDSTDDASPTAPEAPTAKPASTSDEIEGVFIRATVERRCRAGFCFDKEGQGFAEGVLSDKQLEALESDPLLKVERCTFSGNQEGE